MFKGKISSITSIYNLLEKLTLVPSMNATVKDAESSPCPQLSPRTWQLSTSLDAWAGRRESNDQYVAIPAKVPSDNYVKHCVRATGILKVFKSSGLLIRIMLINIWDT